LLFLHLVRQRSINFTLSTGNLDMTASGAGGGKANIYRLSVLRLENNSRHTTISYQFIGCHLRKLLAISGLYQMKKYVFFARRRRTYLDTPFGLFGSKGVFLL